MRSDYPSRRSVFGVGELLTVGVVGMLAASVLGHASDATPRDGDRCTLTFRPAEFRAGQQPLHVDAFPSAEIGIPDEVRITGPSGLDISLVQKAPIRSIVDPRDAEPGEMEVTLRQGGSDVCRGRVTVRGRD